MAAGRRLFSRFAIVLVFSAGVAAGWVIPARVDGATVTARATIDSPIGMTTKADLAFVLIVPHPTKPGTVVVNPDGSITCDSNLTCSGVSEPSASSISGDPLKTFTITIPSGAETVDDGANSMTVDGFTSSPETSGTFFGDGTATVFIGATLHVAANQPAGAYSGSFDIGVQYE